MTGNANLQTLLTSRRAGKLAFWLSRSLPLGAGIRLARWIGRRIAARGDLPVVQALRINQWVVSGGQLDANQLELAVQTCLQNQAIAFFQLFRCAEDAAALENLVIFDSSLDEIIARSRQNRCGLVVAGLHVAGFDLVVQAAARRGLQAIALSLPEANRTVEWQHAFRRRSGIKIYPGTLPSLRFALQGLSAGEMVLTGIDRPTPELKYRPRFFGRPAPLPTHHIYLAQKAGVPIMVVGAAFDGQRYRIITSGELNLMSHPGRAQEITANAELVLEAAQDIIRQAPYQWTVPHPVWPDAADELPVINHR